MDKPKRHPAFRGPLNTPGAVRAAIAGGMSDRDVVLTLMWDREAARGDKQDPGGPEWVARQIARRTKYYTEKVAPLMAAAGRSVDAERVARWLA